VAVPRATRHCRAVSSRAASSTAARRNFASSRALSIAARLLASCWEKPDRKTSHTVHCVLNAQKNELDVFRRD
jgi:hypothetical protein